MNFPTKYLMQFKLWLEARFKGFKRQFVAANPHLPNYVANDIYNSRIGYLLKRGLQDIGAGQQAADVPTIDLTARETTPSKLSVPSGILGSHGNYKTFKWSKKPVLLSLTPNDFDDETKQIFLVRRFGFNPIKNIRKDSERTNIQKELLKDHGLGKNEPVIMIKQGDRYKLLEGWHRTMACLVSELDPSIGAPPNQVDFLKSGRLRQLDFGLWKPVPIQAYVGENTI